jgi:hypothetical protein
MGPSKIVRIIATICFVLAVFVPTPVLLVPVRLALWCGSTLMP